MEKSGLGKIAVLDSAQSSDTRDLIKGILELEGFIAEAYLLQKFSSNYIMNPNYLDDFFLLIAHLNLDLPEDFDFFNRIDKQHAYVKKIIISTTPDDPRLDGFANHSTTAIIAMDHINDLTKKINQLFPCYSYLHKEIIKLEESKERIQQIENNSRQWQGLEEKARMILENKMQGYIQWKETGAFAVIMGLIVATINWAAYFDRGTATGSNALLPFSARMIVFIFIIIGILIAVNFLLFSALKRRMRESIKNDIILDKTIQKA